MTFCKMFLNAVAFVIASWNVGEGNAAQATAAFREISGGRHRSDELSDSQLVQRMPLDTLPPQTVAARVALEAAAVPVTREPVGSEGDRSITASFFSALRERVRRVVLPAVGGEGMDSHTARRLGKGVFCVMLVIFIFCFGCCWDDSEGLSAAVAGRLLKAELWSSRPPLAGVAVLEDLPVAKLKGFAGSEPPAVPPVPGRRMLPAVLPAAAGELPGSAVRLAVPLAQLQAATWTSDVFGFMGLPVLFARLWRAEDGERFLEISTVAERQVPLVTVSSGLAIRLGGGGPRPGSSGGVFGALVPEAGSRCSLVLGGGRVAMAISGGDVGGSTAPQPAAGERLSILQMPGRRKVGTVSRLAASMAVGEEHLEVSVGAGAELDAALVLACALASRAFGPDGRA